MIRNCTLTSLLACLLTLSAGAQAWKGKILYSGSGSEFKQYDPATRSEKVLLAEAGQATLAPGGDIYYLEQAFRKRNVLVRRSNPAFTQFRDVLDMTGDNPRYKKQLEAYSFINRTGNSAVMSYLYHPKVSPNGKYLSVTIYGYGDQIFNKNCVGVFDIATGELVARFDEKYYGSWTPDNRLVVSGSDKTASVDGGYTKATTPGIFISDARLTSLKRIDPDLDDPSPYHAIVSPDGRQVAFILNNHVWAMHLDGSNLRQLTEADNDNIETFPVWSPDSRQVACWSYKTFERSYYTAIAIVPATAAQPTALRNNAPVWPKDSRGYRISGGSMQLNWKGEGTPATVKENPAPETPSGTPPPKTEGPKKGKAPAPPAPAPLKAGTTVRIPAEDGQTYTGTIREVKAGKYRVAYNGFAFEAWLTKEQFEVIR